MALEELGDGTFQAKLERSPFYPEGGGQVSDRGWIESEETGDARRAHPRDPCRRRPGLDLPRARASRWRPGQASVPWSRPVPDDGEPHRNTSAASRRSATHSATTSSRPGSAVRPDKLRFDFKHDKALTPEEREQVERAVEREGVPEPAGPNVRDADRGGAEARRDDAFRREVRRRGARCRDRRLLPRALWRDARPFDGRDRAVRDPVRGLGGLGRPPHRGDHRRRGLGGATRALGGAGRDSGRSSSARGRSSPRARRRRPARTSSSGTSPTESWSPRSRP